MAIRDRFVREAGVIAGRLACAQDELRWHDAVERPRRLAGGGRSGSSLGSAGPVTTVGSSPLCLLQPPVLGLSACLGPSVQNLQPAGALLNSARHAFEAVARFARRAIFPPHVHGSLRSLRPRGGRPPAYPGAPFPLGRAISPRGCSSLLAFFANCDRRARLSRGRVVARAARTGFLRGRARRGR